MPYHLVNSVFHALNSVMLFLVALRLLGDRRAAFISALLFAFHPANSEAVSWVYAGGEAVKVFFMLVSFNLYLMYREDRRAAGLVASALFFLLACLSGQGALVLPLVMVIYEVLMGDSREGRKGRRLAVILFLSVIVLYFAAFRGPGEVMSLAGAPGLSPYNAIASLGYYWLKLLLPLGLGLLPPLPVSPLYPLLGLGLLTVLFFIRMSFRLEAFLVSFVIVMALPPVLVAMSGSESPIGIRYMYAMTVGFSLLAGAVMARIKNPRALAAAAAALALLYAVGSIDRALVWGDRNGLWEEAARINGNSVMHKINLSASLIESDRLEEAKRPLRMALQDPRISSGEFQRVMEMLYGLSPGSDEEMFELLSMAKGQAKAYFGMGFYYFERYSRDGSRDRKNLLKAMKYLAKAVEEDQSLVMARYYLGLGYLETGELDKSIIEFTAVQSLDPAGRYSPDAAGYLDLATRLKELSGRKDGKPKSRKLKIDLK
jgi:hypothetical protein